MSQNQADSIIYDNEVENAIDHDPIDIEAAHQRYRDDRILPPSTIQDSDTVQGERFFKHQKRGEVCVVQVKRSCWKQWVNDLDKVIHVKWIHKNDYLLEAQRQRSMKEARSACSGSRSQSKKRKVDKLLVSQVYECNRSGKPQERKDQPKKNERTSLIESKKVECTAKLWVTCKESNPEWVSIMYNTHHQNHQPGSMEDIRYMPKSQELVDAIVQRLSEGQTVRAVRDYFRRFPITQDLKSRDAYIITDDVYNEFIKLQSQAAHRHNDEHESAKVWVKELTDNGHFAYYSELDDNKFAVCISTKWQRGFFAEARGVCLDATHDVTGKNVIMYTIVTQHQDTWRGFPIAYLITDSQASPVLTSWLQNLRQKGLKPKSVTIDCSLAEDKALRDAWAIASISSFAPGM
ncbi:hypothetical protein O0I10_012556 [Lichtheimia ornata]|uniref:MULE transposase domain-containing protein n=1 Tax=Lichtheimia ornata TaxID=688661 RepID=A0AAD7XSZ3_9FUNG|nr:uncharacterized protein O0I10_012556 [Lichtheimia ornata]KAJ8651863.1 hypothetical protein O0I10_012556 [Lichtheimia ornata]